MEYSETNVITNNDDVNIIDYFVRVVVVAIDLNTFEGRERNIYYSNENQHTNWKRKQKHQLVDFDYFKNV